MATLELLMECERLRGSMQVYRDSDGGLIMVSGLDTLAFFTASETCLLTAKLTPQAESDAHERAQTAGVELVPDQVRERVITTGEAVE
jgi:hypothetical protein